MEKQRNTLFDYDQLDVKIICNIHEVDCKLCQNTNTNNTYFIPTVCPTNDNTIIRLILMMNDNSYSSAFVAGTWKFSCMREGVTDFGITTRFLWTWNRIRTFEENVERTAEVKRSLFKTFNTFN